MLKTWTKFNVSEIITIDFVSGTKAELNNAIENLKTTIIDNYDIIDAPDIVFDSTTSSKLFIQKFNQIIIAH